MRLKLSYTLLAIAATCKLSAAEFYVCPSVTDNSVYTYNDITFTGGKNAFSTIAEAVDQAKEYDKIYVQPGTYPENIIISTSGLFLSGANAYGDNQAANRTAEESIITGTVSVNANNVTINGFRFTGTGRVTNTSASTHNPLTDFTFSYNVADNLTPVTTGPDALLRMGTEYSGTAASLETNNCRYSHLSIINNVFKGNADHRVPFIALSNASGHVNVTHNSFTDGGQSVSIANSQDSIDINHNRFHDITTTDGQSVITLKYIGAGTAHLSICNNEFVNCHKPLSGLSPIHIDQGKTVDHVTAATGTSLRINHNVIKNFTTGDTDSDHDYFAYADASTCTPITIDSRFNRCDNSKIAYGMAATPWETEPQRYTSGSTGLFDFDAAGVTADYYETPIGTQQHQYRLKTNAAAQSFDIDTETGDIYYIQTEGSGDEVLPLRVTRYLFRADKTTGRQYMYLTNASHGANMSVFRHNGKVWIATGGASIYQGHCKPQTSVLLPFVSGATADCGEGKTSFTHNNKTYQIIQFRNQWGKTGCYPAIDVDNRLFCESHNAGSGKTRFAVYDLDDVIANGSNAKLIKAVMISNGSNKYENPDKAYSSIVMHDDGFGTSGWAMQGFDISGDLIYRHGGVGLHNDQAYSFGGKSVPTIMQDCINWRDSVYVHRKPVLNPKILNAPNGEPEGVKIVRDANGQPHMIMGIVWGTPSQRTSTLVDFAPPSQGFAYDMPEAVISPASLPSHFYSSTLASQSKTIKIEVRNCIGHVTGVISGPDAACFSVGQPTRSGIYVISDRLSVTFTPSGTKRSYLATLRVSAPGATDRLIPLSGSYTGQLSGIDNIKADCSEERQVIGYYDLNGRKLNSPAKGITIVRYSDGTVRKLVF